MNEEILIYAIVGIIVNCAILYIIIAAATRANTRAKYEWVQAELLAKIARAQGVSEEEIKATFAAIN
jgi:hypothetical protein